MKTLVIFVVMILAVGFAWAAAPVVSLVLNSTSGPVGSEYTVTVTNLAPLTLNGLKFYFGSNEVVPISSNTCVYSSSGMSLKPSEQAICKFKVPEISPGMYSISIRTGTIAAKAVQQFNVITSPSKYESLLSKIKVGTKVPDEYTVLIGDGDYQGYVVTPDIDMNRCTATHLISSQIKYSATFTIAGGKITSVSKGKVSSPTMEICLTDKAIDDLQNSTDVLTTVNQELESGNMGYTVNDTVEKIKISFMQIVGAFLGGQYVQIVKMLSYAK